MIPPDDIFIKASCLRPLRINHRYFNQLHNLVKRDSEPPVRMSPRYHLIGISWLPIGNLHQSICKQNLGNQKNLLKKVKYITLGKVFYHYNYRTIIRLSKFNLKIVYNFLLPCSCMSFTQEFDICLIFNVNKMGKLQIPLKIPKKSRHISKEEIFKYLFIMKNNTVLYLTIHIQTSPFKKWSNSMFFLKCFFLGSHAFFKLKHTKYL